MLIPIPSGFAKSSASAPSMTTPRPTWLLWLSPPSLVNKVNIDYKARVVCQISILTRDVGDTFNVFVTLQVTNAIGTGEIVFEVNPPQGDPFGKLEYLLFIAFSGCDPKSSPKLRQTIFASILLFKALIFHCTKSVSCGSTDMSNFKSFR